MIVVSSPFRHLVERLRTLMGLRVVILGGAGGFGIWGWLEDFRV